MFLLIPCALAILMFANTRAIPSLGNKGITATLTTYFMWVYGRISYTFAMVKKISVYREMTEKYPTKVLTALKIKKIKAALRLRGPTGIVHFTM